LQSLQAELQRHQETIASLKSERDAMGKELDRRKDIENSGFIIEYLFLVQSMTTVLTEIGLKDVQERLQRESTNGTSLAQSVQQLESALRSVNSKADELEGSLAGSRSERERLSMSLRDAESGRSFSPLSGGLLSRLEANSLSLARQHLDGRLKDAVNAVSDLENRLGISQQELTEARTQASQHQQTISLLVSEKNALAASADRLAELEPRKRTVLLHVSLPHYLIFE
jgi:DNA repair exonuclease SbcCD ATPase subunit